jgi:glycosyltransferase involved in cell wall biosynthesis
MNDPLISIVISARNEFPNIVHTIHSIINDLESSGYGVKGNERGNFEILLVDNGSEDRTSEFFTYAKSNDNASHLISSPRGMITNHYLKIVFDPTMGNVSARNTGAKFARGKYLFFCDGHLAIRNGAFAAMIKAIDETGGLVHPVIEWMGAYPPKGGWQYSLKLGEKFWGTWNRLAVDLNEPFYIPMSGHCCLGMLRKQFEDFHGYNDYFRVYGGGETYLDLKWWMFGSTSVTVPKALVYHLSAGRGYSYKMDDLVHNMALSAYLIGGMKWWERILITYINKPHTTKSVVHDLCNQAIEEAREDREFIEANTKVQFEEVLKELPWDKMNDKKFGHHSSGIIIFEDWLTRLTDPEALEIYKTSKYQ